MHLPLFTPRARRFGTPWSALFGVLALAPLAGCDIFTSAPITEVRWVVPSQGTTLNVGSLLPAGVSILPDSSAFALTVAGASATRTLSQDCAQCAQANGLIVPKPAFQANASASSALPSGVSSATLRSGGALDIVVVNGFDFDPLRPSAAAGSMRGYAVITVRSGTTVIGRDSVNGSAFALPANGGTLARTIPLSGVITDAAPLTVSLLLDSPAGDPIQMDASKSLTIKGTPRNITVASASVSVSGRQLSASSDINLSGIDDSIVQRVQSGALLLDFDNPFAVSATLTVRATPAGGQSITKPVALVPGASSQKVSFTQAEIRALLGHRITLTLSGAVNDAAGSITITPRQVVKVTTRIDLALRVGG